MEMTGWIAFADRSPTQDEIDTDRVLGYVILKDLSGKARSDFFGKIFWNDETDAWAVENFDSVESLTNPGVFDYSHIKPSHWCLVD